MNLGERMKDISKKTNTIYLLDKYELTASKKFGQNFLIDTNIIKRIVENAYVDKETCVIEVGPGIGALTEYLSYYAKKVICYEIDERLKDVLAESLSQCDNVSIIFQDFLTVHLSDVIKELRKDYEKICVVTNLPYYITSDIIEKIISNDVKVDSITAMVQKEVAVKLTNKKTVSPLTLLIDAVGYIDYCFTVSKNVFMPSPHVDSAIIHIEMKQTCPKELKEVIMYAFQQKRKTIYNNLKSLFKDDTKDILKKCQIDEKKRPEQLNIEDYKKVSHYL